MKRLLQCFDTTSTQYKRIVARHNGVYYVFHVELEEPPKWDGRAKFVADADLRRALHLARLIQPEDGAIMFTCTGTFN